MVVHSPVQSDDDAVARSIASWRLSIWSSVVSRTQQIATSSEGPAADGTGVEIATEVTPRQSSGSLPPNGPSTKGSGAGRPPSNVARTSIADAPTHRIDSAPTGPNRANVTTIGTSVSPTANALPTCMTVVGWLAKSTPSSSHSGPSVSPATCAEKSRQIGVASIGGPNGNHSSAKSESRYVVALCAPDPFSPSHCVPANGERGPIQSCVPPPFCQLPCTFSGPFHVPFASFHFSTRASVRRYSRRYFPTSSMPADALGTMLPTPTS